MLGWRFDGLSEIITVRCRRCDRDARMQRAFTRFRGAAAREASLDTQQRGRWEGRDFVIEHFPDILPRAQGANSWFGFSAGALGVVSCPYCAARYPHRLVWPRDAFYAIETRAGVLWAWNRDWLMAIREWIAAGKRPDGYLDRHFPTSFKLARHRKDVVKSIDAALRGLPNKRMQLTRSALANGRRGPRS